LISPGTSFKGNWRPFLRYERGDVVDLAGDVYICIANTYTPYGSNTSSYIAKNTYPTDTNYWTQILGTGDRDRRLYGVQTMNQQPLGWTRNLGGKWTNGEAGGTSAGFGYIDVEGNCNYGGYKHGGTGIGDQTNGYTSYGFYQTAFLYTGWQDSTQNGGAGRLTTPDGEAPKVTQMVLNNNGLGYWVLNNGELYASGTGGQGQLGNSSTSTRYYPVRVDATDTTDWLGNTIPYTFRNSRIVKVASTVQGYNSSSNISTWALDDIGQVWAWGYNGYGQLGLGQDNATAASVGNAQTNQTRPRCIPRSFFEGKKIVDIYAWGGVAGSAFAIDEEGGLWAWGQEGFGELGLGARHGSITGVVGYHFTPTKVPIDFNLYGGIQKIWVQTHSTTTRFTFILDGEGKIWVSGYLYSNSGNDNTLWTGAGSGTGGSYSGRFIRLVHNWWRDHEIENFWVIGDYNWTMYMREKGTGITYSVGHNYHGVLGQQANTQSWWNSGGFKAEPGRVDGVTNVVEVWNNCGSFSSSTSRAYMTPCLLTEEGQLWGMGSNDYGSLGQGYSGNSYNDINYDEIQNSANVFKRIPHPGGYSAKWASGAGWPNDTATNDIGLYLTDQGQAMIAGFDGTTGHQALQGHFWATQYYQSNIIDPGAYVRYHIHGYPGS
jgi:alpha-tubulin suppressor-like RCC1 family protein